MMSNRTALIMILLSFLPLGMSLHAVFLSGSEVQAFSLQGREGKTRVIRVSPDMNPLRLLIAMDYGAKSFGTSQRYISYEVAANDKMGLQLWNESGRVSVSGENKITGTKTHYSSLQTFNVEGPDELVFQYQIKPQNLRYKGGELTLKRNVKQHNWLFTIVGLVLLIAGILIYSNSQKKTTKRRR